MQRRSFLAVLCGLPLAGGCGYAVGPAYGPEIRTVYIPVFTSESFRRGFELQLTEAVQKRVQDSTTFRLARGPSADTVLYGRIVEITKRLENQNRYDDPRELELGIAVEARWEEARTGRVLAEQRFAIAPRFQQAISQTSFAPETGQSLATATKDAVDQLAEEIVHLMEAPW
ncbi:MAG: hypothetical protein KF774_09210 [Planctomyces sp.]|nr:hypothetical protein [Planctomyces sp.]